MLQCYLRISRTPNINVSAGRSLDIPFIEYWLGLESSIGYLEQELPETASVVLKQSYVQTV